MSSTRPGLAKGLALLWLAGQSLAATYNLTLSWADYAPDGFTRKQFLVNGQFPGPVLDITEGDAVVVNVQNDSPFNTTIHFHGIEQRGSPWSDGVPGITQRPIPPGCSYTYEWTATQYGAYWYHAHYRGQIDDGLWGPITIHPRDFADSPFGAISQSCDDLAAIRDAVRAVRPLMISDWQHHVTSDLMSITVASGVEPACYDAVLVNGMGRVDCWDAAKLASLMTATQKRAVGAVNETALTPKGCLSAKALVHALAPASVVDYSLVPADIFDTCTPTAGSHYVLDVAAADNRGWLALDIISSFGLLSATIAVDNHPMWIYAVDGAYIEPQLVDAIPVANGQRYSVLLKLATPGDWTIRVASVSLVQTIAGYATLSYAAGADDDNSTAPAAATANTTTTTTTVTPYINDAGTNTSADVVFFNQHAQKAYPPSPIAQTADALFKFNMKVVGESWEWALNDTVYPEDRDAQEPLLYAPQANLANNVTVTTRNNTWIDLVFITATWPQAPHPIHKHGNKMYLIGQGDGAFPWASVAEAAAASPASFNLVDPPRRDTFVTASTTTQPAWMALRYWSSSPGAWFLHCHIDVHLEGGMAAVIQDGIDVWPQTPAQYKDVCGAAVADDAAVLASSLFDN